FYRDDIDSLRAVEEQLRNREAQLLQVQHIARVGSWEIDLGSRMATASSEAYRMANLPANAPLPLDEALQLIHPADIERVRAELARTMEQGTPLDIEYRLPNNGN